MTSTTDKPETVTKAALAEALTSASPVSSVRVAATYVDSIIDIITSTLSKGEEVKITGFGKFVLQDKKARKGRNPQTGEELLIADRRILRFKTSNILRAKLNGLAIPTSDG